MAFTEVDGLLETGSESGAGSQAIKTNFRSLKNAIDALTTELAALGVNDIAGLQAILDAKASSSALSSHMASTNNPHSVTKSQVGLGNVDNTSDASKPISIATQTALDAKASTSALTSHTGDAAIHRQIDDSAGLTATTKLWSADKIAQSLSTITSGLGNYVNKSSTNEMNGSISTIGLSGYWLKIGGNDDLGITHNGNFLADSLRFAVAESEDGDFGYQNHILAVNAIQGTGGEPLYVNSGGLTIADNSPLELTGGSITDNGGTVYAASELFANAIKPANGSDTINVYATTTLDLQTANLSLSGGGHVLMNGGNVVSVGYVGTNEIKDQTGNMLLAVFSTDNQNWGLENVGFINGLDFTYELTQKYSLNGSYPLEGNMDAGGNSILNVLEITPDNLGNNNDPINAWFAGGTLDMGNGPISNVTDIQVNNDATIGGTPILGYASSIDGRVSTLESQSLDARIATLEGDTSSYFKNGLGWQCDASDILCDQAYGHGGGSGQYLTINFNNASIASSGVPIELSNDAYCLGAFTANYLQVGSNGEGVIIPSPDGTLWKLTISDAGAVVVTPV